MSFLDRFRSQSRAEATGYEALELDTELAETLRGHAPTHALSVRPDKSNAGIGGMKGVLKSLHSVSEESPRFRQSSLNVSPAHAFELKYAAPSAGSERVVTLQYVPGSEDQGPMFERQLQQRYPESHIETTEPRFLTTEPGQYIAGATLTLRRYTLYPIANDDLPGFDADPTGAIIQEMVAMQDTTDADADVVCQILFKPARRTWTDGIENGHGRVDDEDPNVRGEPSLTDLSYNLRQPTYETRRRLYSKETIEKPPSTADKKAADLLENQLGEKAWRLCLRVLAVSDEPEMAIDRASKVAGRYRNFYEAATEQSLLPEPLTRAELAETAARAARRGFIDTGIVKSQVETAGLVNIPEAQYINTNKFQWELGTLGDGIPPGTPRYQFSYAGLADPTPEEKQLALLDSSGAGDPLWVGFGSKHGTEAGIYEEYLNAHMQVTGGTRKGKTTALTNLNRQLADRGHGGLVIVNGKENDEDRFVEEFPLSREDEDFVFIDTGDPDYGTDKQIRFNLLEIPTSAEPGSTTFDSAAESLAEDWAASFAEAGGGSNDYWGPLMDRVTKTVIVGLAKRGKTATPLDVAAACSSSDGLEKFRQFMDEDRIEFVRQQAARIAEKEDADLEPLAGRMDILTRHGGLRNFLCARDPSASIQDLVAEGKWCVLRIDPNLSESETKFTLTPLVRRFHTAKKTQPDAPLFYLIWDEFDKGVSANTNIHELLSIAGGHGFRMILSCQAPSNQLYGKLKDAMQNQIDTAISFGTGEEDAKYVASHHTVDADALSAMARYKFWLRTYWQADGDEGKTQSYLVDAFPPTREVRQELEGEPPRDADRLKRESVERYGDIPKTAEELQAESVFYGDSPRSESEKAVQMDERTERLATQAVYDTAIRAGDPDAAVPIGATLPALRCRIDGFDGDTVDAHQQVYQHVRDQWIAIEGDTVRARNPRNAIAHVGENRSAGGAGHASLLFDAYRGLTEAGLDVTISAASGTDPDGLATPIEDPADRELVDRLLGGCDDARIEAEHQTGATKPGATIRHLNQAREEGRAAIVLVRPEMAEQVRETVLGDPPGYRSGHDRPGERRLYTSPRDLTIGGDPVTRPGGRENVWVETADGEYILRDEDGTGHARFESVEAVFTNADPYPRGGETVVKRPVIPAYDPADVTLVVVPEGAAGLDTLDIAGYPTESDGTVPGGVTPADLDVPDRAASLFGLIRSETDGVVTITEAHDLASDHGIDVSRRSVEKWINRLTDEGALLEGDYRQHDGREFEVAPNFEPREHATSK